MSKHTPGPWVAKYSSGAGLGIWADLRPALGEKYSKDFSLFGVEHLPAPKIQIAYETWVQFPSSEWDEMQKANVALMAAAPELLEALKALLEAVDYVAHDFGWPLAADKARAAISKAEGKA